MILVGELGLTFRHEGDHWRCAEYPGLVMLPGPERYRVCEQDSASL
jgi:hypothetical protein